MERKVEKTEEESDYLTLNAVRRTLEQAQRIMEVGLLTADQSGVEAIRININRALTAVKNEMGRYSVDIKKIA